MSSDEKTPVKAKIGYNNGDGSLKERGRAGSGAQGGFEVLPEKRVRGFAPDEVWDGENGRDEKTADKIDPLERKIMELVTKGSQTADPRPFYEAISLINDSDLEQDEKRGALRRLMVNVQDVLDNLLLSNPVFLGLNKLTNSDKIVLLYVRLIAFLDLEGFLREVTQLLSMGSEVNIERPEEVVVYEADSD